MVAIAQSRAEKEIRHKLRGVVVDVLLASVRDKLTDGQLQELRTRAYQRLGVKKRSGRVQSGEISREQQQLDELREHLQN